MNPDFVEAGRPIVIPGNEVGVLLCHGFGNTPWAMRSLAEHLHATEGWTVLAPRLQGHGESVEAMARSTAEDWVRSVESALDDLHARCKAVAMAGLSMGGCLTLYMAALRPRAFKAIVPINAALYFNAPDFAAQAFDAKLPPVITGFGSDVKDRSAIDIGYPGVVTPCIRQIYSLMAVTRDLLPRVNAPTLVLASPDDHVVPVSCSEEIIARVGASHREMRLLHNSFHMATLDHDKAIVNESTRLFIRAHL